MGCASRGNNGKFLSRHGVQSEGIAIAICRFCSQRARGLGRLETLVQQSQAYHTAADIQSQAVAVAGFVLDGDEYPHHAGLPASNWQIQS